MTHDPWRDPAPDQPIDPEVDTTVASTPVATTTTSPTMPVAATSTTSGATLAAPLTPATTQPETASSVQAVAVTPVGDPRKAGRLRWGIAAGAVALVVGVSTMAAFALTGSSPTATVTGYVPADSVMYGEVRLDLPGDQKQMVGEFLSKFPGFADQAALDTKLDEVLDRLVAEASDGKQTFTADIKPWFDGEVAVALGPLPSATVLTDPATEKDAGHGLVLLSIKDAALADAWFDSALADIGATTATETYDGVELTVYTEPNTGSTTAFGLVDGKVAIAGDLASVKAAIDTGGDSGLVDAPGFAAAQGATTEDHIGFVYMDLDALMSSALELTESMASAAPVSASMTALVPDWAAFHLRVEGDALVMDGTTPHVDEAPGPSTNRANGVAAWAPPTTVALAAGNDYGATILEAVDLFRNDPNLGEIFDGIDQVAGFVGGLESAVGWIGDAGVVVSSTGDGVEGGIVAIPTDAADAQQLLTSLRNMLGLVGAQGGIEIRDETYNGATITIVDLGSLQDLAGMAGAMGGESTPTVFANPLDGDIELAYAATDDVVVIGSGSDFVKHVLDAGAGESLADTARYRDLVSRVGSEHTGVTFFDVTGVRGLLEAHLPDASAEDRAEYEESIKPFLTPFDAFVAASVVGGDLDQQNAIITVK